MDWHKSSRGALVAEAPSGARVYIIEDARGDYSVWRAGDSKHRRFASLTEAKQQAEARFGQRGNPHDGHQLSLIPGDIIRSNPRKHEYQFFVVTSGSAPPYLGRPLGVGSLGAVLAGFSFREDANDMVREYRADDLPVRVYTRKGLERAGYVRLPTGNFSRNPARRANWPKAAKADSAKAAELRLYIENDGDLYRSMTMPIVRSMQTKQVRGKFDPSKAAKGFLPLATAGAKKYARYLGAVNPATRMLAAAELVERYLGVRSNPYVTFTRRRHRGKKLRKAEQIALHVAHTRATVGRASDKPTSKLIRVVNPAGGHVGYAQLLPKGNKRR